MYSLNVIAHIMCRVIMHNVGNIYFAGKHSASICRFIFQDDIFSIFLQCFDAALSSKCKLFRCYTI
jgi:hypothetical protein